MSRAARAEVWYDLPDGRRVESYSEEYRAACEAWAVLGRLMGGQGVTMEAELQLVEKRRGTAGRERLWNEIRRMAPFWEASDGQT